MLKRFNLRIESELEEPLLGLADTLGVSAFSSPQITDAVGMGETDFVYTGAVIVSFIASTAEQDTAQIEGQIKAWMSANKIGLNALSIEEYSDNQDWMQPFKAYFQPVRVNEKIVVRAPWSKPVSGETPEGTIFIDPGMAFGTGTHETSRLCLRLLSETDFKGDLFFDIGAGSGILSFYLIKNGAESGIAIEIEGAAAENMRKNASLNGISDKLKILCADLKGFKPPALADGITANITSPVIAENLPLMAKWLKQGGWGIFSGVNDANAKMVKQAFSNNGFKLIKEITENDWHGFKIIKCHKVAL